MLRNNRELQGGGRREEEEEEGNEETSNGEYSSIPQMLFMRELHRNTPNFTFSSFHLFFKNKPRQKKTQQNCF